jgi:hypothetical protein
LLIAAAIDVSGYAATCILLKEDPFTLMRQFLNCDVGVSEGNNIGCHEVYYGILTPLYYEKNIDSTVVIIGGAIIGIIITTCAYLMLKNIQINNKKLLKIILFSPAIICSHIWSYSWDLDKGTLVPVIILFSILFIRLKKFSVLLYLGLSMTMLSTPIHVSINELLGYTSYKSALISGLCILSSLIPILILFKNKKIVMEINTLFPEKE